MRESVRLMAENVQAMCDAGVRKTTFYPLIAQSLKETTCLPQAIRRAKAFAHLLDNVEQPVLEHEIIAGSISGMWPLDKLVPTYDERRREAVSVIEGYISKRERCAAKGAANGELSFESRVYSGHSRFALMARDHYDANIDYHQLQRLIIEMRAKYPDVLQNFEIGRELERHFNYDYGADVRALFDGVNFNVANHVDLNYQRVIKVGFGGIRKTILEKMDNNPEFYGASLITIDAAIRYIARYAGTLRAAGKAEMAAVCDNIASGVPTNFREGVQLVWLTHLIANIGGGSAMSFARFDQYMRALYENDASPREDKCELLCNLWLKVNEPKMRTVQSLSIGGVTPDGRDGASDLTRLILEVAREMKLPYPNLSVRLDSQKSPEWLYRESIETVRAGAGQPMLLSDDAWVPNLMSLGYPAEIAREYYNMGCVEILIQGQTPNWIGAGGVTFPQLLIEVLNNGGFDDFDGLMAAYVRKIKSTVAQGQLNGIKNIAELKEKCCEPFASAMVEGCLESGVDFFMGGTACPPHAATSGLGLGTAADSLAAIKKYVYDDKQISFEQLMDALNSDFEGWDALRMQLDKRSPTFGNDEDSADAPAKIIFDAFVGAVYDGNAPYMPCKFVPVLFSYNSHVNIGEITGATPNGRRRGETFSDAIGPSQGKDMGGPTRLVSSILKLDLTKVTGAFALNMKLVPAIGDSDSLIALVKGYFAQGGPQIQINFMDTKTLEDARIHPDKHRNLVVRIAGYCEYFVNLDDKLKCEIIARTLHAV